MEDEGELEDATFIPLTSQKYRNIQQKFQLAEVRYAPMRRRLCEELRDAMLLYCEINRIFDYGTYPQWIQPVSELLSRPFGGKTEFPEELITKNFLENDERSVGFPNMQKCPKH